MNEEWIVRHLVNIVLLFVPLRSYRKRLRKKWLARYRASCFMPESKDPVTWDLTYVALTECPESFSFPTFSGNPVVSIIIPVYNQYEYTRLCLWTVLNRSGDIHYEVIIGDDSSSDETKNIQDKISNIQVVRQKKNKGFLLNCNEAASVARGKYILFLNNDTQVQEGWLKSLVDLIESDEGIGLVGSKMIFPDNSLQEAGGIVFNDGCAWNYNRGRYYGSSASTYLKEVDYVSGCSIMLGRRDWEKLGGFDTRFKPAYYEDTDLCFSIRERLGKKVVFQPLSVVMHFEGVSCGTDTEKGIKSYQVSNRLKFLRKWKSVLKEKHAQPGDLFHARDRSMGKKTLLFVDYSILHYSIDAGSRASFQYLKYFVDKGYNVKFLPVYRYETGWPYLEAHEQLGVEVLHDVNFGTWIKENGRFLDYVYLNRPNITLEVLDLLKKHTHAKLLYQGHDLHHLRLMRQYEQTGREEVKKEVSHFKKMEMEVFSNVDVVFMFSTVETDLIHNMLPNITADTVPLNILNASEMPADVYEPSERKDIMFIGGFGHAPNADGILWFVNEVLPLVWEELPALKFNVMGSNVSPAIRELESDRIIIKGFVTDDELKEAYRSAKMSVIPLRYGAGVKGKVIEAVFNKVPVLTTSIGAEGIDNELKVLSVEDDAREFASRLVSLYRDDELLKEISSKSELFIRQSFSLEAVDQVFGKYMDD